MALTNDTRLGGVEINPQQPELKVVRGFVVFVIVVSRGRTGISASILRRGRRTMIQSR